MVGGVLWTWGILLGLASAGPLSRFPRDTEDYQNLDLSAYANFTANEVCFSDNEVFQKGDVMPNPGPCEECKCEPPSIVCQMVKCPVNNNGCRTIQKPNHCCPDYNCVCDYNGQLYNDGERLDLPDQPCQVCYCKGGEVMCTSLTCYIRDDCEPKHTPGQCCPKYENCPLRDMEATNTDDKNVRTRSPHKSNGSPKREMQPWLLTKSALQTSTAPKQPEEITTAGGNVIIVSDWLSERRTTPEDSEGRVNEHTDRPDMINGNTPPKDSQDKSVVVKNSDTITPLDEVIFTRIDMLKGRQDVELNSSSKDSTTLLNNLDLITTLSPMSSNSVDEYTSTIKDEFVDSTIDSSGAGPVGNQEIKNSGEFCEDCTTYDYTQPTESSSIPAGNEDTKELVDNDSKHVQSRNYGSTVTPIKQVMQTPVPSLMYSKKFVENKTVENSSITSNVTNIDLNHSGDKAEHASENIWNSSDLSNYSNNKTNYIKPNGSFVSNVSNINSTGKPITTTLPTTQHGDPVSTTLNTNLYPEQDEIKRMTQKKWKDISTLDSKAPEQILDDEDSPTPSVRNEDVDTTTPYFVEDHMVSSKQQSLKSSEGNIHSSEDSTNTNDGLSTYSRNISVPTAIGGFTNNIKEPIQEVIVEKVIDSGLELTNTERPSIKPLSSAKNIEKVTKQNFENPKDNQSLPIKTENFSQADPYSNRPVESNLNIIPAFKNKSNDGDKIVFESEKKEESEESLEVMSNVPLVMDLNSHIPFLQIGGQTEFSTSTTIDEDDIETTTTYITSANLKEIVETTLNPLEASSNGNSAMEYVTNISEQTNHPGAERKYLDENNQERVMEEVGETTTFGNEVGILTTSNIPLTPGDLKIIAEHIIKEKIKPVTSTQKLNYTSNDWLHGNLTSEDKIASIISAANVSINIMNQTNENSRNVTSEKPLQNKFLKPKSDQFEKDTLTKGNALTSTENSTGGRKTSYLNKKNVLNEPILNRKQMLNDGIETNIISTMEPNMSEGNTAKPGTSTQPNVNITHDAFLKNNQSKLDVSEVLFSGLGDDVNKISTVSNFNSSTPPQEINSVRSSNIISDPIINSALTNEKKTNGALASNINEPSETQSLTTDYDNLTTTENTLDLSTITL